MLRCKQLAEMASDYLDKELPLKTRISIRVHLFMCYKCQRYVDQLKTTIQTLAKLRDSELNVPNENISAELLDAFRKSSNN